MKIILITIILLLTIPPNISAQTIVGKWKAFENQKPSSIVQIYKTTDGTYQGKMVQLLNKDLVGKKCKQCKDERKSHPYLNLVIIKGLKANKDKKSANGGKILDPDKGKEYNCKIWIEGKTLKMRAYWGMFYATRTWYKVS